MPMGRVVVMLMVALVAVVLVAMGGGARAVVLQDTVAPDADPGLFARTQYTQPLKGFMNSPAWGGSSGWTQSLDFHYVPVSAIMFGWGNFSGFDSYLEPLLAATAAEDRHAVLRFWLDYPGQPSGVPGFLYDKLQDQFRNYTDYGGGESPPYDNVTLIQAMNSFTDALAQRVDSDPRVAVIQVGLFGFWGEHHTYPHTSWYPTTATQQAVFDTFVQAFNETQLQVRKADSVTAPYAAFGMHDDSFCYSTVGPIAWYFWSQIQTQGVTDRWETAMLGGELRPELQSTVFTDSYDDSLSTQQNFSYAVSKTHVSFLLNYYAYGTGYSSANGDFDRAAAGVDTLGYKIFVARANLTVHSGSSGAGWNASLSIALGNSGVAPFYYPLHLLVRVGDTPAFQIESSLRGILPEAEVVLTHSMYTTTTQDLANIAVSLNCSICYATHPVLLENMDVNTTTGELPLGFDVSSLLGGATDDYDDDGSGDDTSSGGGKKKPSMLAAGAAVFFLAVHAFQVARAAHVI